MNQVLVNRVKSFLWRAGALAVVAVGAYILNVGDLFKLDGHQVANLAGIAVVGLIMAEVTKWLNTPVQ